MGTNDRIIRDEQPDEGIFEHGPSSAPRIDLILGVALAIVASVLGVLGSLGFTAPLRAERDARPDQQMALAAPADSSEMSLATLDAREAPVEWIEAPVAPEAPAAFLDLALGAVETEMVELEGGADRDAALVIVERVRAAMNDSEFDARFEDLRVSLRSLLEHAARMERIEREACALNAPITRPAIVRRAALPAPRVHLGI